MKRNLFCACDDADDTRTNGCHKSKLFGVFGNSVMCIIGCQLRLQELGEEAFLNQLQIQQLGRLMRIWYVLRWLEVGKEKTNIRGSESFFKKLKAAPEINLAELLWISCRQDLNDLKEAFEDLELHLLEETPSTTNDINRKGHSLAKENIQKLLNVLHPQLKQAVSDCIRKNNLLFQKDFSYSEHCSSPCLELRPIPCPAPSPASESPDFSPDPLQSPASSPPPLPIPSHQAAPPINDLLDHLSPANSDSENKETDNSKTIIVACVVTAGVTSVVAALFFFLCSRRDSGAKQNDDRPLLSLSLSEFSGGSSHAYTFGSNKEEKLGHQSFGKESSLHKKGSTNGKFTLNLMLYKSPWMESHHLELLLVLPKPQLNLLIHQAILIRSYHCLQEKWELPHLDYLL
ncbi:hypothetical protein CRYUN_Cryun38cG0059300 [Craigia yunnanensis]